MCTICVIIATVSYKDMKNKEESSSDWTVHVEHCEGLQPCHAEGYDNLQSSPYFCCLSTLSISQFLPRKEKYVH